MGEGDIVRVGRGVSNAFGMLRIEKRRVLRGRNTMGGEAFKNLP